MTRPLNGLARGTSAARHLFVELMTDPSLPADQRSKKPESKRAELRARVSAKRNQLVAELAKTEAELARLSAWCDHPSC
jgi:hypothetical protein